jgi:transcriptional regulator GlxA family with amidase domain
MARAHRLHKLCRIRDLLRDCLDEPLSLDDLSMEARLSPWHLLRAFRQAFGETPHDFLTRLRLERAQHLLTVSGRSVTEICFDVGFTSLGSFSSLFRRKVGLSPAAFRRRVRAWVTVPGRYPWAFVPFCFGQFFAPVQLARSTPDALRPDNFST